MILQRRMSPLGKNRDINFPRYIYLPDPYTHEYIEKPSIENQESPARPTHHP